MSDEPRTTSAGWRLIEWNARQAPDEALRRYDREQARRLERERAEAEGQA